MQFFNGRSPVCVQGGNCIQPNSRSKVNNKLTTLNRETPREFQMTTGNNSDRPECITSHKELYLSTCILMSRSVIKYFQRQCTIVEAEWLDLKWKWPVFVYNVVHFWWNVFLLVLVFVYNAEFCLYQMTDTWKYM